MKLLFKYIRVYSILLILMLYAVCSMKAQLTDLNIQQLDISRGLNDGIVRCIAEDQYGYMWIGTVGALNRFDGAHVERYVYLPNDSTTINPSQPRCMHSDVNGRFWIGTEDGLMEYDFSKNNFKHASALKHINILAIESINPQELLIVTKKKLYTYQLKRQQLEPLQSIVARNNPNFTDPVYFGLCKVEQNIYLATDRGLLSYHCLNHQIHGIPIEGHNDQTINLLQSDKDNKLWLFYPNLKKLIKIEGNQLNPLVTSKPIMTYNTSDSVNAVGLITDNNDGVWIATRSNGLFYFNAATRLLTQYKSRVLLTNGPKTNNYRFAYKDKQGIIWLACDVEGISYFQPNQRFFKNLLPFPDEEQLNFSKLGRAICIDQQLNVWMGNHDGLSRYNPRTQQYIVWRNLPGEKEVLYNNIIRSLYCDAENNVWIGTGSGVNRYNSKSNAIEFIPNNYLPNSWYNSINEDKSGNIWFCTNDTAGLYWYSQSNKSFQSIAQHPLLKSYNRYAPVSYVFEDSRQRIWISFSRKGVLMLDKKNNSCKTYQAINDKSSGIIGNQIIDIKEDDQGIIWVSSFNGITGIDVEKNKFHSLNSQNGFTSNLTSSMAIDPMNRIWLGVNGALTMIETDRNTISRFTTNDGLSSVGFHEHAACISPNGEIWMPTYIGYLSFNPKEYRKQEPSLPFYVSHYSVFDVENFRINPSDSTPHIRLKPHQNSFTFNMVALNYLNPDKTWYAYRLEGFEDEWHYSSDPKAVYTNVPGGNYNFVYQASKLNASWKNIPVKRIHIQLDTIYYKTWWFRALLILAFLSLIGIVYQYRSLQQTKVFELTKKAQDLEKDKAMVMYENLKQQLNPHFLFNSLSSLKSLIKIDASEAVTFLENLSKSYRYILRNRENETIALSEEIQFAQNYIALQKSRHGSGFEVIFNIDEIHQQSRIVPVTLQNLIENALKHNIMDDESPLQIEIYSEGQFLIIKNNLQRKKSVETSNRSGLAQLQNFYTYLSSSPVQIIESSSHFVVKIPFI